MSGKLRYDLRDRIPLAIVPASTTRESQWHPGWECLLQPTEHVKQAMREWPLRCQTLEGRWGQDETFTGEWLYRSPMPGFTVQDLIQLSWLRLAEVHPSFGVLASWNATGDRWPTTLREVLAADLETLEAEVALFRLQFDV